MSKSEPLLLTRINSEPHYMGEATIVVQQEVGKLTSEYIPNRIELGDSTRLGSNFKREIRKAVLEDTSGLNTPAQQETIDVLMGLVREVCNLRAQVLQLQQQLAEVSSGRYLILK